MDASRAAIPEGAASFPGENNSEAELEKASGWFAANLGPDVPWHFTAFHPDYKMLEKPSTPPVSHLLS